MKSQDLKNRNVKKTQSLIKLFNDIKVTDKQQNKEALINFFPYKKLLKIVFKYVFDPSIKHNFEEYKLSFIKTNVQTKYVMLNSDDRLKKFFKFLNNSSNRRVIDSDYNKLNSILTKTNSVELKLLFSILNKKLNVGISGYLINKLFPNLIKYPTSFMSCHVYNPLYEIELPVILEPKEQGIRVKLTCYENGKFTAYTKSFIDVTSMFERYKLPLLKIVEKTSSMVEVDGMLFYKNIKETFELVKSVSTYNIPSIPEEYSYRLIDFIINNKPNLLLENRKKNVVKMASLFINRGLKQVSVIPFIQVYDKYNILKACHNSIKNGNKGIVLKDLISPYTHTRDSRWLSYENPRFERGEIVEVLRDRIDSTKCSCIVVRDKGGIEKMVTSMSNQLKVNVWTDRNNIIGLNCMIEKCHTENRLTKIYYYKGLNV